MEKARRKMLLVELIFELFPGLLAQKIILDYKIQLLSNYWKFMEREIDRFLRYVNIWRESKMIKKPIFISYLEALLGLEPEYQFLENITVWRKIKSPTYTTKWWDIRKLC